MVTASEIDLINKTVRACWLVPNGVRGARNLVVKIRIKIAKDGTIQSAQIANPENMGDPVFRAAAESAQRAPMDPKCNKIPLNPAKYKQWETIVINFDPADMQ
ncbi:cell envelope integrity protein TolA [Candidatus Odyssella acanthamoebae]|uniref:TolA protein n=1 Tax=Candidatus Odyssella acanthamoebae TaxID=91604 RepID=A0A077AQV3_9PROT|nr:cell envelope integrity protein TolA [Candidatus Paracaedibacter acanthamoebae]AIK95557.1 hypothetical protein ID47_00430 [Candidatus Paracaedibacter acanthamoebae]